MVESRQLSQFDEKYMTDIINFFKKKLFVHEETNNAHFFNKYRERRARTVDDYETNVKIQKEAFGVLLEVSRPGNQIAKGIDKEYFDLILDTVESLSKGEGSLENEWKAFYSNLTKQNNMTLIYTVIAVVIGYLISRFLW